MGFIKSMVTLKCPLINACERRATSSTTIIVAQYISELQTQSKSVAAVAW